MDTDRSWLSMWVCLLGKLHDLSVRSFIRRRLYRIFDLFSRYGPDWIRLRFIEKAAEETRNFDVIIRRWKLNGDFFIKCIDLWQCWLYRVFTCQIRKNV